MNEENFGEGKKLFSNIEHSNIQQVGISIENIKMVILDQMVNNFFKKPNFVHCFSLLFAEILFIFTLIPFIIFFLLLALSLIFFFFFLAPRVTEHTQSYKFPCFLTASRSQDICKKMLLFSS